MPRRLRCSAAVIALLLVAAACAPPRPVVEWDSNPETVVLRASLCCAYHPYFELYNNLAEAVIWGDGRVVWVEWETDFSKRHVLTGQLTPDQMHTLLQQYGDAGFWNWDSFYGQPVPDLPDRCLEINLSSTSHRVCDYPGGLGGAPKDFRILYDLTVQGAGAVGVDYAPTQGYLVAFSDGHMWPETKPEDALDWSADELGVQLLDSGGIWLDGEALALAWQVINEHPLKPLVREGDRYFMLSVLLPDLSMYHQPPPGPQ